MRRDGLMGDSERGSMSVNFHPFFSDGGRLAVERAAGGFIGKNDFTEAAAWKSAGTCQSRSGARNIGNVRASHPNSQDPPKKKFCYTGRVSALFWYTVHTLQAWVWKLFDTTSILLMLVPEQYCVLIPNVWKPIWTNCTKLFYRFSIFTGGSNQDFLPIKLVCRTLVFRQYILGTNVVFCFTRWEWEKNPWMSQTLRTIIITVFTRYEDRYHKYGCKWVLWCNKAYIIPA